MSPASNSALGKAIRVYNSQRLCRAFSFQPRAHSFQSKVVETGAHRTVPAEHPARRRLPDRKLSGVPFTQQFRLTTKVSTGLDWNRPQDYEPGKKKANHPINTCLRDFLTRVTDGTRVIYGFGSWGSQVCNFSAKVLRSKRSGLARAARLRMEGLGSYGLRENVHAGKEKGTVGALALWPEVPGA
ncbi:hypothetical protein P7K49_021108 [Saguinus oedipus]|uniref:Uncharacterized protein n=1 Tax=Saguinus oedipus TaxID=9490 RepID=A0ABQ9USG7_SAGOE|nr:hypothetical protein P7K49_021108 [Saguinus oedipus]